MFGAKSVAVVSTFLAFLSFTEVNGVLTVKPVNLVVQLEKPAQFNCSSNVSYPNWISLDYMYTTRTIPITSPGCIFPPDRSGTHTELQKSVKGGIYTCNYIILFAANAYARKYICQETLNPGSETASAALFVIDPFIKCLSVEGTLSCRQRHNKINPTATVPILVTRLGWIDWNGNPVTLGLNTVGTVPERSFVNVDIPPGESATVNTPFKCIAKFNYTAEPPPDVSREVKIESNNYYCTYPNNDYSDYDEPFERNATQKGGGEEGGGEGGGGGDAGQSEEGTEAPKSESKSTASVACVEMFALVASLLVIFIARCFQVHTLPTQDVG